MTYNVLSGTYTTRPTTTYYMKLLKNFKAVIRNNCFSEINNLRYKL